MSNLITLLTDFGLQDDYIGLMKAMIYRVNPELKVVDLCHHIPPGNIETAAFVLLNDWEYFPDETVHLCVVDPGVGTSRKILIVELGETLFIAPDNGLLSPLLRKYPVASVYKYNPVKYYSPFPVSNTFHGRDIFAQLAARLASGFGWDKSITEYSGKIHKISIGAIVEKGWIKGKVMYIDHFGNLITNLELSGIAELKVVYKDWTILYASSYGKIEPGTLFWYVGSKETAEIAVAHGSALKMTGAVIGDEVKCETGRFVIMQEL